MYRLLLFVVSFMLLAACAPSVTGGASYNPFDLANESAFTVMGSGNWYFKDTVRASYFDLDLGDIPNSAFDNGDAGDTYKQSLNGKFTIESINVPEGWEVGLPFSRGVQTITEADTGGRRRSVSWRETVEFSLVVSIPENYGSGTYPVSVMIQSKDSALPLPASFEITIPDGSETS